MIRVFILVFVMCALTSTVAAQEIQFQLPLHGEQGKDFFISNYPDHDTSSNILDPFCGVATYNGHKGTDMSIRGFKEMDSGVVVYAAADGKVASLHDGEYDRNKHWIKGKRWNFVCIAHKNGYFSYYGHLRKLSILVNIGDSVKAGQPLGLVGSSGFSTGPHLHFEVWRKDTLVDPFAGPCNGSKNSLWLSQLKYDTGLYAIDKGFVPYVPGLDTLREGYLATDTFYSNDTTICFWTKIHGLHKGDNIHTEWYDTKGFLWDNYSSVYPEQQWIGFPYNYINARKMPERKGTWKVKRYVNGRFITSADFYMEMKKRKHPAL